MTGRARAVAAAAVVALSLCAPVAARASSLLDATPDLAGATPELTGPAPALAASVPPFAHTSRAPLAHVARLQYSGGQVLHSNRTHVIFWEPAGSGLVFPPGYETLVVQFLQNVAADSHLPTNTYSLSGQYTDSSGPAAYNSTSDGAVVATDPLPRTSCVEPLLTGPGWSVCLSDAQLQNEIERVVAVDHMRTGPNDIYLLLTPPGLGSCESSGPVDCALGGKTSGSYCGYHSVTSNSQYLYAVIPYNAEPKHCQSANPRPNGNPADPTLSTISHEQLEVVTDPYGDAWVNTHGSEAGDICITSYGPPVGGSGSSAYNEVINGGHYYLQELYSNWSDACEPRAAPDSLRISLTGRARAGRRIPIRAHAVAAHGRITSYQWTFGTQATSRGAVPRAVLATPGSYPVTVRSTDTAGLWAFAHSTIVVAP